MLAINKKVFFFKKGLTPLSYNNLGGDKCLFINSCKVKAVHERVCHHTKRKWRSMFSGIVMMARRWGALDGLWEKGWGLRCAEGGGRGEELWKEGGLSSLFFSVDQQCEIYFFKVFLYVHQIVKYSRYFFVEAKRQ